ncbi:MAG TPA: hypothetical protein PKZ19_13425 [Zoogloea sp.]|nr:hypothetical protein [Zoogloea sp.]
MNQEHPENSATQSTTEAGSSTAQSKRRKLIQTGLVGAPVLLALKSTPVLAANCKLPSGFSVSGNLSRNGTTACSPKLNGVGYWVTNATLEQKDRPFAPPNFNASIDASVTTFGQALAKGDTNIHAKIVAAFLSADAGSFLPLATVKDMWNLGVIGGAYPASAGDSWDKIKVEAYLDYILS